MSTITDLSNSRYMITALKRKKGFGGKWTKNVSVNQMGQITMKKHHTAIGSPVAK